MNVSYSELAQKMEPVIKQAGHIIRTYFRTGTPLQTKGKGSNDVTTAVDITVEEFLKSRLTDLLGAAIHAEESGKTEHGSDYAWVIDPLDGTTNFAHGIGYFCVSVALTKNDEPVIGVLYNPLLEEYFYAIKGKGAFCNKVKLALAEKDSLPLVVLGISHGRYDFYSRLFDLLGTDLKKRCVFRHFGAGALDLAYVAAGRIQAVMYKSLKWWDVAAGLLLIQEAGGKMGQFDGNPISSKPGSVLAGTPRLYGQLLEIIKKA